MSATYDPTLPTDRDWVRLLTGDSDTSAALLSDEEIDAIVAQEATDTSATGQSLRLFAAARCLEIAQAKAFAKSAVAGGLSQKTVQDLTLKWGTDASSVSGWQAKIAELRRQAAWLLAPTDTSRILRSLGPTASR